MVTNPKRRGAADPGAGTREVERVQSGMRLERRIVLHAFEGRAPFTRPTLDQIAALKKVFGLQLVAADSHNLVESRAAARPGRRKGEA
jgi:hypothetical protein